jgi:nitroreductase
MGFFDLIEARHSVRAYLDRPVDPQMLRRILAAADLAPSAGDLQAYRIVIVERQETKNALAAAALGQDFIASAPVVLVFVADSGRSRAKYGERGASLFCIQDATIAAAYAQLAATELGLACCWVGAFREQPVAQALAAPAGLRPVAMVPIGHAAEAPERPPRRSLESLCRHETF